MYTQYAINKSVAPTPRKPAKVSPNISQNLGLPCHAKWKTSHMSTKPPKLVCMGCSQFMFHTHLFDTQKKTHDTFFSQQELCLLSQQTWDSSSLNKFENTGTCTAMVSMFRPSFSSPRCMVMKGVVGCVPALMTNNDDEKEGTANSPKMPKFVQLPCF